MVPDVNVLVSAARLEHPHHKVALAWLQNAVARAGGGEKIGLLPPVIAGFLRITTNPKIFPSATPIAAAVQFMESLMQYPGVVILASGSEWPALKSLCNDGALSGNAIPDAWIAAQVLHHRETLATFDRDFQRLLPPLQLQMLSA
jgi:uncharacterized protein